MKNKLSAIWLGKLLGILSRKFGKGQGSAITGLYALKLDPALIEELINQIPRRIVVTGTNGKSTTARLITNFARGAGLKVLTNSTGSNLERGIASSIVERSDWLGQLRGIDLAVWELDEAAFRRIADKIKPETVVVLNAFRDQLDRYGEVDSVVNGWKEAIMKIEPKPELVLNGDDANVAELGLLNPHQVSYFGLGEQAISGEKRAKRQVKLDLQAKNIDLMGLDGTIFEAVGHDERVVINLPLGGMYQIYNFLAAYLVAKKLMIDDKIVAKALEGFEPIFGRVEKLRAKNGKELVVSLIKNPVGATEVIDLVSNAVRRGDKFLICLNDNFADGRDVSWIWDIELEKFRERLDGYQIVVSGTRAEEMVLRLKYAGFNMVNVSRENDLSDALSLGLMGAGRLFVLPTYTALMSLERIFSRDNLRGRKK